MDRIIIIRKCPTPQAYPGFPWHYAVQEYSPADDYWNDLDYGHCATWQEAFDTASYALIHADCKYCQSGEPMDHNPEV